MKVSLLDLDLAVRRDSTPIWVACVLLAIAVALYLVSIRPLDARIAERALELTRVGQQAPSTRPAQAPRTSLLEERLAAFESTLCESGQLGAYVGTVFEVAAKQGLALAQAEYKLDHDKAGGFSTYQMTLPVRGPYPRLRRFVDATLAEIACAALETVDFKREGIGATEAEARLRFVFFLKRARP
ncbi:MAG: hypothetical protein EHM59_11280 [Betaproteobacteria bacterium]|nr:MAG: hypothetical protein EHM59_11280 [Betaproteobacteria bacterium]